MYNHQWITVPQFEIMCRYHNNDDDARSSYPSYCDSSGAQPQTGGSVCVTGTDHSVNQPTWVPNVEHPEVVDDPETEIEEGCDDLGGGFET